MTAPARPVVAITGATAGIGLGVARQFALAGAAVVAGGRREERGRAVEAELRAAGLDVTYAGGDTSTAEGAASFVDRVVGQHGRLDVLVNNAGSVGPDPLAPFDAVGEAAFDEVLAVNLKGPFFATQAAARVMVAQGGGTIVDVGSAAGELVSGSMVPYAAAKAGAMFMSRCLAEALAPCGVKVHTVVMYRVASEGGRRTLEARIANLGLTGSDADAFPAQYDATAVEPEDVGRAFVRLVEHGDVMIGPGFVVRP